MNACCCSDSKPVSATSEGEGRLVESSFQEVRCAEPVARKSPHLPSSQRRLTNSKCALFRSISLAPDPVGALFFGYGSTPSLWLILRRVRQRTFVLKHGSEKAIITPYLSTALRVRHYLFCCSKQLCENQVGGHVGSRNDCELIDP